MAKNLKKFGSLLYEFRVNKELSIREICRMVNYDPSNWSKIERGLISPPAEEKVLKVWAKALNLKEGQTRDFIDYASIAQGIIPCDIRENKEVLQLMPAFFRTIRNKKPTKKELDDLIKLIKNL